VLQSENELTHKEFRNTLGHIGFYGNDKEGVVNHSCQSTKGAEPVKTMWLISPNGLLIRPTEEHLLFKACFSEILSAPVKLFKFLELCAARYFGGMRSPEFLEALSQNLRGLTTSPLLEMALNELGEKMGLETKTLQSFLSSRGAKLERSEEDIYNAVSKKKPVDVESIEEQMAKLLINTPS